MYSEGRQPRTGHWVYGLFIPKTEACVNRLCLFIININKLHVYSLRWVRKSSVRFSPKTGTAASHHNSQARSWSISKFYAPFQLIFNKAKGRNCALPPAFIRLAQTWLATEG